MKAKTKRTELVCLQCGNIVVIHRIISHKRCVGHIKDLWCYKCKDTTKHYEIQDKTSFFYRTFDDELHLYVKYLLWPNLFNEYQDIPEKVKTLTLQKESKIIIKFTFFYYV